MRGRFRDPGPSSDGHGHEMSPAQKLIRFTHQQGAQGHVENGLQVIAFDHPFFPVHLWPE